MYLLLFSQAAIQVPEDSSRPLNPTQRGNQQIQFNFYHMLVVGANKTLFFFPLPFVSLLVLVAAVPRPGRHRRPMTAPKTQKDKSAKWKKIVFSILTVIVILAILVTAGYFSK